MRVTFLGTGTSSGVPRLACRCGVCRSTDPRNRRRRSSILVEDGGRRLLVDATPDMRAQLLDRDVDRLDAVFVTHAHADHMFGLDDLRALTDRAPEPLPVLGGEETVAELRRVYAYVFHPSARTAGLANLETRVVEHGVEAEVAGFRLTPLAAPHGGGRTLGLRVGGLAYFTDISAMPSPVIRALQGVDVLILDLLQIAPHPTHLHRDESVRIAAAVGARATWFIHMSHDVDHAPVDAALPPGMRLAYDGLRIDV